MIHKWHGCFKSKSTARDLVNSLPLKAKVFSFSVSKEELFEEKMRPNPMYLKDDKIKRIKTQKERKKKDFYIYSKQFIKYN